MSNKPLSLISLNTELEIIKKNHGDTYNHLSREVYDLGQTVSHLERIINAVYSEDEQIELLGKRSKKPVKKSCDHSEHIPLEILDGMCELFDKNSHRKGTLNNMGLLMEMQVELGKITVGIAGKDTTVGTMQGYILDLMNYSVLLWKGISSEVEKKDEEPWLD